MGAGSGKITARALSRAPPRNYLPKPSSPLHLIGNEQPRQPDSSDAPSRRRAREVPSLCGTAPVQQHSMPVTRCQGALPVCLPTTGFVSPLPLDLPVRMLLAEEPRECLANRASEQPVSLRPLLPRRTVRDTCIARPGYSAGTPCGAPVAQLPDTPPAPSLTRPCSSRQSPSRYAGHMHAGTRAPAVRIVRPLCSTHPHGGNTQPKSRAAPAR